MSKAPLLAASPGRSTDGKEPDARLPFSRLRCIWDPVKAADEKYCKPFARLKLRVVEAESLMNSDLNGLSDPYVVVSINQGTQTQRTKTINDTLAPKWDEMLEYDIYHPSSHACLMVYDEDMGTHLKSMHLLGLDDDHLGWADIHVDKLPFNEWVTAWLPLGHPEQFVDTLAGRQKVNVSEQQDKFAGRIHVTMYLEARASDELYAYCLLQPYYGTGLSPMNLAELLAEGMLVQDRITRWADVGAQFVDWVSSMPTVVLPLAIFLVWHQDMLLPMVALLPPVLLRMFILTPSAATSGEAATANSAPAGLQPSPESQKTDILTLSLSKVQELLPDDVAAQLRITTATVHELNTLLTQVEKAATSPLTLPLVFAAFAALSVFLVVFSKYQRETLQVILSVVLCVLLGQLTLPGRLAIAFMSRYVYNRRRLRKSAQRKSETNGKPRKLSRSESLVCTSATQGIRKDSTAEQEPVPHTYQLHTFSEPTWCKHCGTFLWGIQEQGGRCILCRDVACHKCSAKALESGANCPGVITSTRGSVR